ncbi:hypothetical protein AHAS_Ahas14G0141300 [Arachis hypogaea]
MPGTVNSGEDLEATHLAAAKHAGEAELLRLPDHQRRLHQKRRQIKQNPLRVLGSTRTLLPSLLHREGAADRGYSARRARNC